MKPGANDSYWSPEIFQTLQGPNKEIKWIIIEMNKKGPRPFLKKKVWSPYSVPYILPWLQGGFRQVWGRFGQVLGRFWAGFRRIWRGFRAI